MQKWEQRGISRRAAVRQPIKTVEAIDQAVAKGVTGTLLHGQFEETGPSVDAAIAAGVPVIIVNLT